MEWSGAVVNVAERLLGCAVIILQSLVEVQYLCLFCTSPLSVFIVCLKHDRTLPSPHTLERRRKKTLKGLCLINNSAKAII